MTTQANHEAWDFWEDKARTPAANMAVDDALLLDAPARGRPLLRFYRWDRPAVSIGYVQTITAAPDDGHTIVRRPTGGGIVCHDHDFTYSVIIPPDHKLAGVDRRRSYDAINRAVLAGLRQCHIEGVLAAQDIPKTVDRASMVCFQTPTRYDVLLGKDKVAGSAQRRTRDGILHQGSIYLSSTLGVTREQLGPALRTGFTDVLAADMQPFEPTLKLLNVVAKLVAECYGTDTWNARR